MALSRTAFQIAAAGLISTLSASHQASADDYRDYVYIGCTTVAYLTGAPSGSLNGSVEAKCQVSNEHLGGCYGPVMTSTSKGTPGGGSCTSDYIVEGAVNGVHKDGWMHVIHYAHFDSVAKDRDNIKCSMGGE